MYFTYSSDEQRGLAQLPFVVRDVNQSESLWLVL